MPLIKTELLIPRVLCIGGKDSKQGDRLWPESRLKVGDILTLNYGIFWCDEFESGYVDGFYLYFPHLFKPLPWWYGRTVEEMPEYILASKTYGIVKVNEWRCMGELCLALTDDGMLSAANWEFEPADESDYELYVSKIFTDKIVELSKEKNRLEMTIGKGVTLEKGGFASDRIDEIEKEITQLKDQYKK